MKKIAIASDFDLKDVFEEWKRRYDANPESFQSCEAFAADPPASYGDGAARYFLWLLEDMKTAENQ